MKLGLWGLLALVLVWAGRADSQQRIRPVDFLDERMKVPDSGLFVEADYIESGIGLRFGVDKRLSYFSGQYEEATQRFEESVRSYRYKAEIWVFLARSYFYQKNPHLARQTIERAAVTMPDLNERFWTPLLDSMLGEIRKRALSMQAQVDFYSRSQDDFLTLFRLYVFLQDEKGTSGVIERADNKSTRMALLATMVSGDSRRKYNDESAKWSALADQLRSESESAGFATPAVRRPSVAAGNLSTNEDAELIEKTRLLQLKVDFYQSQIEDFRELFENYQLLGLQEGAREVIAALVREEKRVRFMASAASDFFQESEYLDEAEALATLRKDFSNRISISGTTRP